MESLESSASGDSRDSSHLPRSNSLTAHFLEYRSNIKSPSTMVVSSHFHRWLHCFLVCLLFCFGNETQDDSTAAGRPFSGRCGHRQAQVNPPGPFLSFLLNVFFCLWNSALERDEALVDNLLATGYDRVSHFVGQ